jgi:hypothetical protein
MQYLSRHEPGPKIYSVASSSPALNSIIASDDRFDVLTPNNQDADITIE